MRDFGMKMGVYTLGRGFLPGMKADNQGNVTLGEGKHKEVHKVVSASAFRAQKQRAIANGRNIRAAMLAKGTIK